MFFLKCFRRTPRVGVGSRGALKRQARREATRRDRATARLFELVQKHNRKGPVKTRDSLARCVYTPFCDAQIWAETQQQAAIRISQCANRIVASLEGSAA